MATNQSLEHQLCNISNIVSLSHHHSHYADLAWPDQYPVRRDSPQSFGVLKGCCFSNFLLSFSSCCSLVREYSASVLRSKEISGSFFALWKAFVLPYHSTTILFDWFQSPTRVFHGNYFGSRYFYQKTLALSGFALIVIFVFRTRIYAFILSNFKPLF